MLKTGQVFNNRYKIISTLGEGRFGVVYNMWDDRSQQIYAITAFALITGKRLVR